MIGFPAANALMLTGDTIEINEIERLGLAYRVVEPEKLDTEALQFAAAMASGPTKALGIMKYELRKNLRQALDDALALELQYLGSDVVVEDRAEGARSFAEGRTPVFTGR
jgi:2-(1,2-epoxy-1,2-dihydrophenyl)acetyl-CoA isomerase